MNRTNKAG